MIRFGATGLGAAPGKASSALVNAFVKVPPLAQLAAHVQI
jgi:hypothetical protein